MQSQRVFSSSILLLLFYTAVPGYCHIYKHLAEAMFSQFMGGGWESKGVSLGLKSNGMTAIIPVPLPIPMFTKGDSGGGGGGNSGGGEEKIKYIPVPVPQGGGKDDWW